VILQVFLKMIEHIAAEHSVTAMLSAAAVAAELWNSMPGLLKQSLHDDGTAWLQTASGGHEVLGLRPWGSGGLGQPGASPGGRAAWSGRRQPVAACSGLGRPGAASGGRAAWGGA